MQKLGFRHVFGLEWRHILSRRTMLIIAIIAPLLYGILVGSAYSQGKVVQIPFVVVDNDNSSLSRDIVLSVQQSEFFKFAGYANCPSEFKRLAVEDRAKLMLVFPQHFYRDVKRGKSCKILAYIDNSNMAIGNVALQAINTVGTTYSVGVDVSSTMMKNGVSRDKAMRSALPMDTTLRVLHNPAFNQNYAKFVLLGIVGIAFQLVPVLMALETSLVKPKGRVNPFVLLMGKVAAYVVINAPIALITMWLSLRIAHATLLGSLSFVFGMTVLFSAMMCMVGVGYSMLLDNPVKALGSFAALLMPAFLLSGFTWPVMSLPPFIQKIAVLLPITHWAEAVRRNHLMGLGVNGNWEHIWPLLVWGILGMLCGLLATLRKPKRVAALEGEPA